MEQSLPIEVEGHKTLVLWSSAHNWQRLVDHLGYEPQHRLQETATTPFEGIIERRVWIKDEDFQKYEDFFFNAHEGRDGVL